MKAIFSFFIFLVTISVFSQEYIPMLQEGNEWSVDIYYCPYSPPNFPTWTVTQQVNLGETVEINGLDYHQVYIDENISCLLREENKIVYKYIPDDNEEKILFDFNLQVGDEFSLIGSAWNDDYCSGIGHNYVIFYLEVLEITYEVIATKERKVIKFLDSFWPQGGEVWYWIEGIGTPAGLGHSWAMQDITCGSALACFKNNGQTYFLNGATSCDNTTLSVLENIKEQTILFPNPVSNTSILKLPESNLIDSVKIVDFNGRLVKEFTTQNNNIAIYAMDYASGLYFYQIYAEGNLIESKEFVVK